MIKLESLKINWHKIILGIIFGVMLLVLLLLVKGTNGSGLSQAGSLKDPGQAFESSISSGRYALLLSIVENKNFNLSKELADFAAPDVSQLSDGRFVSIWPPGSAFILIGPYFIGKMLGFGQLGVGFALALFGFFNSILIYRLALKLGMKSYMALFAGILFLFASNSLAYSVVLSQHQFTTFLLLLSIHIALLKYSFLKHSLLWFVYGFSVVVDLPNAIILAPIIAYAISKDVVPTTFKDNILNIKINYLLVLAAFLFIIPVASMLGYNFVTTGNPTGFGQIYTRYSLGKVVKVDESDRQLPKVKVFSLPFDVNRMPFGLNTLLFSWERGILFFSPVFFLALFGIGGLYKKYNGETKMLLGIITVNLILYSMFGDVAGGWAFGPRYLIPSFAVLAIFVASAFKKYSNSVLFVAILTLASFYSMAMGTLGGISTVLIPPIREASGLGLDPTINVSIKFLQEKQLGSYAFKTMLSPLLNNLQFYYLIFGILAVLFTIVIIKSVLVNNNE